MDEVEKMSSYVRYGRCKEGYFFDIYNQSFRKIFEDLSNFGYSLVQDPHLTRLFGIHLRAFRNAQCFFLGHDRPNSTTVIALSRFYKLYKVHDLDNRFVLYKK